MTRKPQNPDHYYSVHPTSDPKLWLVKTCLRGRAFEFMTASSVFSKQRVDTGTRLLIESMVLPDKGRVLDVGCGYGAVGIAVASSNPALQVTMTDVNARAVRLARENIERNKVENAEVRWGHLYKTVESLTFSCILSNPPVSAGIDTVKAIVTDAPRVMEKKATLQMVIRSKIGAKTMPLIFSDAFGNCQIHARKSGYRVLMAEKQ
jgi:16S rRNA (guanine1207-N2)-methyltransferase